MVFGKEYSFSGDNFSMFSWHGATIKLIGPTRVAYVADETPMVSYLNAHSVLEARRAQAKATQTRGPRVALVGPTDCGKSSLAKILLSYATRLGWTPLFVDLDLGQGTITVPGVISAVLVERPVDIEEGLVLSRPLALYHAHTTPSTNPDLFKRQSETLALACDHIFNEDGQIAAAGMIINTMGWIDGLGYNLLLHTLKSFGVDAIFVLGHDRLYQDLLQEYKSEVEGGQMAVVKLSRSGGVVSRDRQFRERSRMKRIRQYFYGAHDDLHPHRTVLDFSQVEIYRIGGGPRAPQSALPIGAVSTLDPTRPTRVMPDQDMVHCVLAVVHAQSSDEVPDANVAGFLYVIDVDMMQRRLTVLCPAPTALPSKYLVFGTVKWLE
eukprot:TRINITY_DN795_c0_g1::TRINITY_DN795_c0_g1_i1::g.18441::m.18441 TRINITY_DN795_c0_g1::TRINITY_DN795_c0_g1_i1::g.18441  ORF type:complete len:443 (-),score=27.52,sp/Q9SR06/CLP1_ARATH/44.27/2e-129,Clp1/PF06807.9/1.3e-43,MobB/PF03205.9/3.6e-13,ABC_tran/PF00005.22/0.013,ABC_tran/PF00005.22/1.3e+04,AAA_17/PF13207.1/0.33,AAA_17/PF13207.1/9.3e+03 TRINITY_DN795_c0_g1_i1:28-1167(-)